MFEELFAASDSCTLEQLKELSSNRRLMEDSINESSSITDSIAREMSGGLTTRSERVILFSIFCFSILNLEQPFAFYIACDKNLIYYFELHGH